MPKRVLPLTDPKCRNAKPSEKQKKLSDGEGLYLLVKPDGSKHWRFDYKRPSGKRNTLSFGRYPEISLSDARDERASARALLAKNRDPAVVRKTSQEETFRPISLEWLKNKSEEWSDSHYSTTLKRLEKNIFPWLGERPVREITPQELLSVLRRIEERGAVETAHRCRSICGQIFRYAVGTGRAEQDPSLHLKGTLVSVVKSHHPAVLRPDTIAQLLRDIDAYTGHFVVRCAMRIAPLVFQRPGELRYAQWLEIDFNTATWTILIERMKLKKQHKEDRAGEVHVIPISNQAIEILNELYPYTGRGLLVFPSVRVSPDARGSSAKPLSENTLNAALRNLGYDKNTMTTHGWRSVARSLLEEVLGHKPTAIERQLFHAVSGPLGEAYNRAQHLEERRKMMQCWADYLDGLKQNN